MITDCHIHISPMEMFKPSALELMRTKRSELCPDRGICRSPKAFLKYLDACGIDRAVLINYVAPEVIGFTSDVNQFVAEYVKEDPERLIPCGSLHPRHSTNILADVEQLLRLRIAMIKIHPPHQLLFPNDYLHGVTELEIIYRAAEANGIPVMFHTGTSIFPGRSKQIWRPRLCGRRRRRLSETEHPPGPWRASAMDGDRLLPGAPPSQRLSRHQRNPSENASAILSSAGRDRAQDVIRYGLAGARRTGCREKPWRISAVWRWKGV